MSSKKILITGATGYIGGSILSTLLVPRHEVSKHSISVLIRGEEKKKVFEKLGVTPILFNSLDESDVLRKIASEYDIVIHTASGSHTTSAKALIEGLADRKQGTGKEVHYIHTSGTSNIGDRPVTGTYLEDHIFSDREDIFSYLKKRESIEVYAQRTTDIVVVETGLAGNVPTHIIMSPTIYGTGTGLYNKLSIQIPTLTRSAIKSGQAEVFGEGKGIWDYVHISDLTKLYELLLVKVLAGEKIPAGKEGILFSSSGRFSWKELSQNIADALFSLGAIKTKELKTLGVQEAREKWSPGTSPLVELGFASNSRTTSDIGYELGWRPVKTAEDFKKSFVEDAKLILEENKKN